jgi:WXG100 family type VII secretion target
LLTLADMSGFVVDLAAMHSTAVRTATAADAFDAALARLRCEVEDVVSSRWSGTAAAAFAAAWQQWHRAADDVVAALARMGDELARTGVDYRLCDEVSSIELRTAS